MQTFIRLSNGKTITFEFANGSTTIYDIKCNIIDRENYPEHFVEKIVIQNANGVAFSDDHILTRGEFGDTVFCMSIQ